jgi:hypothetical protein
MGVRTYRRKQDKHKIRSIRSQRQMIDQHWCNSMSRLVPALFGNQPLPSIFDALQTRLEEQEPQ